MLLLIQQRVVVIGNALAGKFPMASLSYKPSAQPTYIRVVSTDLGTKSKRVQYTEHALLLGSYICPRTMGGGRTPT